MANNLLDRTLDALKDMVEEFRMYDLPYGSKAYDRATDIINEVETTKRQNKVTEVYKPATANRSSGLNDG